jgi:lipopolysaccharide export system permease protein
MKIYNKYIFNLLFKYFSIVLATLLMVVILTQSIRLIELITSNGLQFYNFIKIISLLITPMSYIIMPIALFITVITLFYNLITNRELVILKVSGMSNLQIARPIIVFASIITILHLVISFYLMPRSFREFKEMQDFFRNKFISFFLEEGIFNTQMNEITVYIEEKTEQNLYKGIFIYNYTNHEKPVTITAEEGYIIKSDNAPIFVLKNGTHQEENKKNGNIAFVTFEHYKFNLAVLGNNQATQRSSDINELYITDLFSINHHLPNINAFYFVNGVQRIIWPIYTFSISILAASILLRFPHQRIFSKRYILILLVVPLSFLIGSIILNNMALKNMNYIPVMLLNLTISILLAFQLFRQKTNLVSRLLKSVINLKLS